jgi:hypothetical protein
MFFNANRGITPVTVFPRARARATLKFAADPDVIAPSSAPAKLLARQPAPGLFVDPAAVSQYVDYGPITSAPSIFIDYGSITTSPTVLKDFGSIKL